VVIEISVAVMAAAVVALVIYLILSLKKVNRTLDTLDETLNHFKPKVDEVVEETNRTLRETRQLVEEIRVKTRKTDALFDSVGQVGTSLQELSTGISRTAAQYKERLGRVVALADTGLSWIRQLRGSRSSHNKPMKVK
jgi:uncharacterized protein YoxC